MDQTTKQVVRAIALTLCGLFAYIMLELIFRDRLKFYLNTDIFGWVVLVAGILLASMVALRAGTWIAARLGVAPDVAHDCCNHDHGHDHHHDHGHEQHAHSHEVSLWRLIVVAMPLMMLMAGLVPTALSADAIRNKMSKQQLLAAGMNIASLPAGRKVEGAKVRRATMKELAQAARDPLQRAMWESVEEPLAARVTGQLMRTKSSGKYQLTHWDMSCCPGDATPVAILVAGAVEASVREADWLEVTGPVSYQQDPSGGYTAVVHQAEVKATPPPSDLYLK
jgi:uncharacterized membrane protein YcgQ (UPF0703/DUF1980 family)